MANGVGTDFLWLALPGIVAAELHAGLHCCSLRPQRLWHLVPTVQPVAPEQQLQRAEHSPATSIEGFCYALLENCPYIREGVNSELAFCPYFQPCCFGCKLVFLAILETVSN